MIEATTGQRIRIEKLRVSGYLLACAAVICTAGGAQATDRGTLEFGISVGATRFGKIAPSVSHGYDYTTAQVRAGLFMERQFSLELSLRGETVDVVISDSTLLPQTLEAPFRESDFGVDLSFLYHLKLSSGSSLIYFGPMGSVDQPKVRHTGKGAQFALGGLVGFKTSTWSINPRFDFFWQHRYSADRAKGFTEVGARLGFSLFFKSSSPWDK